MRIFLTLLFLLAAPSALLAQELPQRIVLGYSVDSSPSLDTLPINTLAPVWFSLGKTGEVRGTFQDGVIAQAKSRNLTLLPVIQGFNPSVIHFLLRDPTLREKLLTDLTQIIDHPEIQGINLDFEGVLPQDRYEFTLFVIDLSLACHQREKLFTMAVPAKISDNPRDEWAWAYNYSVLGAVSDYMVLMTYDENPSKPGPIGSLPWVKQVLAYATDVVPREKILLGIPFYGRVWSNASSQRGLTQAEIPVLLEKHKSQIDQAEELGTRFSYERAIQEVGWYEDISLLKIKLKLAQQEKLKGVAFWRLGQEDPKVWELVKEINP